MFLCVWTPSNRFYCYFFHINVIDWSFWNFGHADGHAQQGIQFSKFDFHFFIRDRGHIELHFSEKMKLFYQFVRNWEHRSSLFLSWYRSFPSVILVVRGRIQHHILISPDPVTPHVAKSLSGGGANRCCQTLKWNK